MRSASGSQYVSHHTPRPTRAPMRAQPEDEHGGPRRGSGEPRGGDAPRRTCRRARCATRTSSTAAARSDAVPAHQRPFGRRREARRPGRRRPGEPAHRGRPPSPAPARRASQRRHHDQDERDVHPDGDDAGSSPQPRGPPVAAAAGAWVREVVTDLGVTMKLHRRAAQPGRSGLRRPRRGAADSTATSAFLGTLRPGAAIPELPTKAPLPTRTRSTRSQPPPSSYPPTSVSSARNAPSPTLTS